MDATDGCAIKVCEGLQDTVKDTAISLRFTTDDCDLYSFWVAGTDGKSRGYTAGGGPGLDPSGIDR